MAQQLAEDERKIAGSIEGLHTAQKTAFSEENMGTLAWLNNFLGRSGSLRAQIQALKGFEDNDFVKQMVKAASVAFGGGRTVPWGPRSSHRHGGFKAKRVALRSSQRL